jgi:ankyrin repeat protein
MGDVPHMLRELSSSVKKYGLCLLLLTLLWPGMGTPLGEAQAQGDAPTALIYEWAAGEALRRGDDVLIKAFRRRKVEIKARSNSGDAADSKAYAEAMIRAAREDDLELVKLLLERGADIGHRSTGNSKSTVLLAAVGNCRTRMIAFLIERGASLDERHAGTGAPLLHMAAGVGCTEVVELLLARGADLKAQNAFGDSVLYAATGSSKQNIRIVELLLDRGADPHGQNNHGYTPLMRAAMIPRTGEDEQSSIEIIKLLLARGASLDVQTFDYGDTALIWAIKLGHTRIAKFLITQGADLKLKDRAGRDALQHARDLDRKEIESLLEAGRR